MDGGVRPQECNHQGTKTPAGYLLHGMLRCEQCATHIVRLFVQLTTDVWNLDCAAVKKP